jgi:hypothetical protein
VLGAIANATSTLRVDTGVTCPTRRYHPGIVAQASATVATMMPGWFHLGVGTGEALNEHVVDSARLYSLPEQPPPLLVAAAGPRVGELAGRIGDGLINFTPDPDVATRFRDAGGGDKPRYVPHSVVTKYSPSVYPDQPRAGPFIANLGGFLTGCLHRLTGMTPARGRTRRLVPPTGDDAAGLGRGARRRAVGPRPPCDADGGPW